MNSLEETRKRLQKIKDKRSGILRNAETGQEIATDPENLPPLREGYARLVHQTHSAFSDSLIDQGLIYNRVYANKPNEGGHYGDISSMAIAHDEKSFWTSLTQEGIRHNNADVKMIFDLPLEECGIHQKEKLAQFLNGTISRGYIVGVIPNYGNQDMKLSPEEMEQKKKQSLSNPLPEKGYETPNWRENVAMAWQKLEEFNASDEDNLFGNISQNTETPLPSPAETYDPALSNWSNDGWGDWNSDFSHPDKNDKELNPILKQTTLNKRLMNG